MDEAGQLGRVVLGKYELVRLLARGGMGSVYLARARGAAGFVRPVVVKQMLHGDWSGELLKMFVREARIMASLRHPNIVSVIDFDREGDEYILVMEYLEGYNLARWARFVRHKRQQFPLDVGVHITGEVLGALHHAHTLKDAQGQPQGIVHRDVTPSNVMVTALGQVKLLDFGIARSKDTAVTSPDGDAMKIRGKFSYVAPEILAGAEAEPCTDVYACGLLLHELIGGRNEIAGAEVSATLNNVVNVIPTRLDKLRPEVPRALADVVARAVEKSPSRRFATPAAFAEALRAARYDDPETTRDLLASMAREDFVDPDMIQLAEGNDLETLARAWEVKATADLPLPGIGGAIESSGEVTQVGDAAFDSVVAREQARFRETVPPRRISTGPGGRASKAPARTAPLVAASWAAAVAALAAMGALVFVWRQTQRRPSTPLTVVRGSDEGDETDPPPSVPDRDVTPARVPEAAVPVAAPATPDVPAAATAAVDAGPVAVRPVGPRTPLDDETRLTRAFAHYRPRVGQCVREHIDPAQVSPLAGIRFDLGTDGHVTQAHVLPESVEPTPLGRCVLRAAQTMEFGPQAAPLTFRVPIEVRSR